MRDVNGTRYHLLLGRPDWDGSQVDLEKTPSGKRLWEYDDDRQVLRLQAEVFTFRQQGSAATPLSPNDRRDSDRDSYGHWYWLDRTGQQVNVLWANATNAEVLFPQPPAVCPPTSGDFRPAEPALPPAPELLSGLAVLQEGYLVVGSPTTNSLLVFDLYALDSGFLRVPLPLPSVEAGVEVEADRLLSRFDLAALADGGLLLLDRIHRQVWRLDGSLRLLPVRANVPGALTPFQPQVGAPRRQPMTASVEPITLTALGDQNQEPLAIAPLPDGSFWVLAQGPTAAASTLWHYSPDSVTAQSVELATANLVERDADDLNLSQIQGYDLAYQPDRSPRGAFLATGSLMIVDRFGNQAYALKVVSLAPLTLRLERQYFPLRNFGGTAVVAVWAQGEVYYHQISDGGATHRWLPIKALPQQRYEKEATLLLTRDGRDPNCLWHRLCVDACIHPETQIQIEARAADTEADLQWERWQLQPTLYKRPTTEVPYSALWSQADLKQPYVGTWELLFQQVRGRHLQLRLTLKGNGRTSPSVRALRVHYPRFSYLREYLPDVYQQDPTSLSFLDRFLANPEGVLTTLEGTIAQAQTLFDARTVPADGVEWLASWVGLVLDPAWSDYQRRLLLAQTPYFFQRRGTLPGLMQAILLTVYPAFGPRLFQDDVAQICPTVRVVERFLTRESAVAAGDPTEATNAARASPTDKVDPYAHRFTVMLPTTIDASTQRLVERIVELEKPAHTSFTLKPYWALFRVGEVRLGLDTVLGQGGQFDTFRLGQSALAEAALGEVFPYTLTNRTVISR